MDIKPIRTKADHKAALKEIESLMMAKFGTPEMLPTQCGCVTVRASR